MHVDSVFRDIEHFGNSGDCTFDFKHTLRITPANNFLVFQRRMYLGTSLNFLTNLFNNTLKKVFNIVGKRLR